MREMSIDIETYSSVDIRTAGAYAYAQAPDFEILLIAYQMDGEAVQIETQGLSPEEVADFYPEFWEALLSPDVIKRAYNANFERTCLARWSGQTMPPSQWRCTAVHATTLGLPRSLEEVGKALGLSEDKQKLAAGKALIKYFCQPCKPTKANGGRTRNFPSDAPEKWQQFMEYNAQDVVTETAIKERLIVYPVTETEQKLWELDQEINDRGILLDMDLVKKILAYDAVYQEQLQEEARTVTGLENPNSVSQLKAWISENSWFEVESLDKEAVQKMIDEISQKVMDGAFFPKDVEPVLRVLEIRQEMAKTSTKKYAAMVNAVCTDGRLRGTLQFYGANRTGRWSGKIVQPHNLPQNKIPDLEAVRELVKEEDFDTVQMLYGGIPFVFSQLIRTALTASEGHTLVVSDFSAIEARVIAWLADEEWVLDVFRTHGKIYEATAAQMFHVPIEKVTKGSKLRQQGKIAQLALGYQGSIGAIKAMDKSGSIADEEIPSLVEAWRAANPHIVKYWSVVERAARTAIEEHRAVKLKHDIVFSYTDGILFVKLPSGRKLAYYAARVEKNKKGRESITYSGVEQDTKRWGRLETYGGKLVENIVQATARDCLAVAMMRIADAGYQIISHVHDEIICDVPAELEEEGKRTITAIFATPIPWAPGLPLKGDTYSTPFYKKD